jgi:hypothetical protein
VSLDGKVEPVIVNVFYLDNLANVARSRQARLARLARFVSCLDSLTLLDHHCKCVLP